MNVAVLTAGGIGSRAHQDLPKQFLTVENKPTQTPHSYRFDELWTVHNQAIEDGVINMAASCLLMQKYGYTTYFSKGSEKNIKITTVEDIEIFKALLSAKNDEWIKK